MIEKSSEVSVAVEGAEKSSLLLTIKSLKSSSDASTVGVFSTASVVPESKSPKSKLSVLALKSVASKLVLWSSEEAERSNSTGCSLASSVGVISNDKSSSVAAAG